MKQLSPEWFAERCGKVTASRVADVMAKTKSGPAASRANYMAELIAERLTGQTAEAYTNAAMQWGSEHEQEARDAYSFYTEREVELTGFVPHPDIDGFGASPDGLVSTDGLIEVKCPNTATHLDTLTSRSIPEKYQIQMQAQMSCTGRQWNDFVSYDPRLPERLKLFVKRIPRDPVKIAEIEREVKAFLSELETKLQQLEQLEDITHAETNARTKTG